MKKETIAEETRRDFNYLKLKVMESDEPVELYLSGSMNKRSRMYKEITRYKNDAEIDYELGVIDLGEYNLEIKAVRLFENSLANFRVY